MTAKFESFYAIPKYYDIAFSYRNFQFEVDAIASWFRLFSSRKKLSSVLELASGPARHAIGFAKLGVKATALDISLEMCDYAQTISRRAKIPLTVINADMINFSLKQKFDLVIQMLDSASHILKSKEMKIHLERVASHIPEGGIYILELGRSEKPEIPATTKNKWEITQRGTTVKVRWGHPMDKTAKGITETTISMKVESSSKTSTFKGKIPLRHWNRRQIESCILTSGSFEIAARFGAFDNVTAPSGSNAWRLIYILKKIRSHSTNLKPEGSKLIGAT